MNLPVSFDNSDFVPEDAFLVRELRAAPDLKTCYDWIFQQWGGLPNYVLFDYTIDSHRNNEYDVAAVWIIPFYAKYIKGFSSFPNT